uniref:Uncharacterized protein n=1 Tax=Arundo donax TaxID=35708 RepID=A0A0A9DUQ2_ARUDO
MHRVARSGSGAGGARAAADGEALVHRHVGERGEPLGDEPKHLVRAHSRRRELGAPAGRALQAAPAAADQRAGVEVALAGATAP